MTDRRTRNHLRALVQAIATLAHSGQISHYTAARALRCNGADITTARRVLLGIA